jgi:hypothetical protein
MNQEQTTTGEAGQEPQDGTAQRRRPYESPRLVPFGHVKELTAGAKLGTSDLSTQTGFNTGSII